MQRNAANQRSVGNNFDHETYLRFHGKLKRTPQKKNPTKDVNINENSNFQIKYKSSMTRIQYPNNKAA